MELQTTLGAMEIATFVGIVLTAGQLLQVYHYFRKFPHDPWKLKGVIAAVSVIDVVDTLLLVQCIYHLTIIKFGYTDLHTFFPVTMLVLCITQSLGTLLAETFFIYRIYTMSGSILITIICASLDATRFAFALAAIQQAYPTHTILGRSWQFIVYASLSAASDILNTAILCITLVRNRSGVQRTDKLVEKLVAYTISSGLLITLVTLTSLICFLTMDNLIWLALMSTQLKLFANSLLASLNARTSMRIGHADGYTVNIGQISSRVPVRVEMETVVSVTDHQSNSIHQVDESKADV